MEKGCDDRYGDLDWLIAIVTNWKNESSWEEAVNVLAFGREDEVMSTTHWNSARIPVELHRFGVHWVLSTCHKPSTTSPRSIIAEVEFKVVGSSIQIAESCVFNQSQWMMQCMLCTQTGGCDTYWKTWEIMRLNFVPYARPIVHNHFGVKFSPICRLSINCHGELSRTILSCASQGIHCLVLEISTAICSNNSIWTNYGIMLARSLILILRTQSTSTKPNSEGSGQHRAILYLRLPFSPIEAYYK